MVFYKCLIWNLVPGKPFKVTRSCKNKFRCSSDEVRSHDGFSKRHTTESLRGFEQRAEERLHCQHARLRAALQQVRASLKMLRCDFSAFSPSSICRRQRDGTEISSFGFRRHGNLNTYRQCVKCQRGWWRDLFFPSSDSLAIEHSQQSHCVSNQCAYFKTLWQKQIRQVGAWSYLKPPLAEQKAEREDGSACYSPIVGQSRFDPTTVKYHETLQTVLWNDKDRRRSYRWVTPLKEINDNKEAEALTPWGGGGSTHLRGFRQTLPSYRAEPTQLGRAPSHFIYPPKKFLLDNTIEFLMSQRWKNSFGTKIPRRGPLLLVWAKITRPLRLQLHLKTGVIQ